MHTRSEKKHQMTNGIRQATSESVFLGISFFPARVIAMRIVNVENMDEHAVVPLNHSNHHHYQKRHTTGTLPEAIANSDKPGYSIGAWAIESTKNNATHFFFFTLSFKAFQTLNPTESFKN